MSMQDRQLLHMGNAQTALGMAADREGEVHVLYRIEAALHELGATIAEANRTDVENAALAEEQAASLRMFKDALNRHQTAIEKAHQGLMPWGEIKLAGEQLQAAVLRLENCGL